MEILKPTPQEQKVVKFTFNATLITTICVCFTLCFGFFKMEKTANETRSIAELEVRKKEAEAKIAVAKNPEYRTVIINDASSHVLSTSYNCITPSRWNIVNFSVQINASLTLSGGQTGTVLLQSSPDNSTWTTICTAVNGNTGSLTLGLNTLNSQTVQMIGAVPPNYYYRLSSSGAASMAVVGGREIAF